MKIKFAAIFLIFILLFSNFCIIEGLSKSEAEAQKLNITLSRGSSKLFDGNNLTYDNLSGKTELKFNLKARYIYLIFLKKAASFSVNGEKTENNFLHCLIDLKEKSAGITDSVTLDFEEGTQLSEISAYTDGALPKTVEDWSAPCEKADLLLVSTHSDDEQLFFAGVLPLYAGQRKLRVQVAYFTNHNVNFKRNHELLNGLWTVGVRNYPEISEFPDAWADDRQHAERNLLKAGFTYEDAVNFQTYLLRRYKPLVAVGHDFAGEYGHGQHILNAATLSEAVKKSADESFDPETAQKYGTHTVKKFYVHLYNENKIILDIDTPLDNFGGKTAFEMTKEGFKKHVSQQDTWFREWLNGTDGNNNSGASIKKYSPREYGLYFSTNEKEDVLKNDFFENITTYDELESAEHKKPEKEKEETEKNQEKEKKEVKSKPKSIYFTAACSLLILIITAVIIAKKRK